MTSKNLATVAMMKATGGEMHGEHGISGERDNWTAEIQRHVSGGAERAGRPGSHPLQQN